MEKGFLDKVEDNATIWIWSEKIKQGKGDSLTEGYMSEFYFTFGKVDLVPTMEEHITLLYCLRIQADKTYSRAANVSTFLKRLMSITGMTHPDMKKRVDIFTLSIYGLVIFPKALRHIDDAVSNLFDRLDERVTPIPVILLGIWGAIRYAPLLVLKWYRSRQFIPATQGLAQYEFVYKGITGHSIENGITFKKLIERFIKMGIVRFDDPSRPNMAGNLLPSHLDQGVNGIIESGGKMTKIDVAGVKSPLK
ncbi:hypothetical protein Gotur_016764 [Gossypium turneri]